MTASIRSDAVGIAAVAITWTVICLVASLALAFLVWVHGERRSYVAMFSFFMSLLCAACLARQTHLFVNWRNIKLEQHEVRIRRRYNPELNIAGANYGVDLVLFYIQYYCYTVEGILAACWATELTVSVYQYDPPRFFRHYGSETAKIIAVLFPAVQMGLLRTAAVQRSTVGFMFLANFPMGVSLVVVVILLFATLGKYISTKRSMMSWHVRYGDQSGGGNGIAPRRNIYDRWLIMRFTLAFFVLGSFEFIVICLEIWSAVQDRQAPFARADLSFFRARRDMCLFMPGVTPALLAFLTFGTTRVFRDYMYRKLVPKRWQKTPELAGDKDFRREGATDLQSPGAVSARGSMPPRSPMEMEDGMDLRTLDSDDHGHEDFSGNFSKEGDEYPLYPKTIISETPRSASQETAWDQHSATTTNVEPSNSKK